MKLGSFLCMVEYFQRFFQIFAEIAAPLHVETSKKKNFTWTKDMSDVFGRLNNLSTCLMVLAFPSFEKLLLLEIDISSEEIDPVPMQKEKNENLHPI